MKVKLWMIFLLCFAFSVSAEDINDGARLKQYLDFLKNHQLLGPYADHHKGEIEIVTDFAKILKVEKEQKERLLKTGYSEKEADAASKVGIVQQDYYWIWIRDAVIFPTGDMGTYNRIMWNRDLQGIGCIAILPILEDNRILLILNYRHATRSWELELPRGVRREQESVPGACVRLIKEETGLVLKSQEFLGNVVPDSGVLASLVPVYLGNVGERIQAEKVFSKAIFGNYLFTKEEIKNGLKHGFLEIQVNGKPWKVPLRDGFLSYALIQAEIKGFLK